MNQWLSAIRKTTISNTNLLNYFHPGVFHKNKWTCCKRVIQSGQWIQSRVLQKGYKNQSNLRKSSSGEAGRL